MAKLNTESYRIFEALIAKGGNTFVFDDETSVQGMKLVLAIIKDMGLDPMKTEDLRSGFAQLFNIEVKNMPDMGNHRFILAPNHVSDFDAMILGLLHPHIRIVSKSAWTNNERLSQFLKLHYDLYGLDRESLPSLRRMLTDAIHYFTDDDANKHFLVFSQGTISDFNNNSPERVSTVLQHISSKTDVPIVPVFVEQVSLEHPTRIVFDQPLALPQGDDFRKTWLEREAALQASLNPPARRPTLTYKHAHNNHPGDLSV